MIVTEYNPLWANMFETEAAKITAIFGKNCSAVHHIGNTSVVELTAKPIIDIMPIVYSLEDVDEAAPSSVKRSNMGGAFREIRLLVLVPRGI